MKTQTENILKEIYEDMTIRACAEVLENKGFGFISCGAARSELIHKTGLKDSEVFFFERELQGKITRWINNISRKVNLKYDANRGRLVER